MSVRACLAALARAHARLARPEETRAALHLPGGPFPPRLLLASPHPGATPRTLALDEAIPTPEADEILLDGAVLLRRVGEAWEIHLLGGPPGLPQWDATVGDGLADLLAQTPDGGALDLGGSPPSRHEALRRAAMAPSARDVFAAADVLHPHTPGIRLQRRGQVGLVLRWSDPCDLWRPVALRPL